jgi:hypothetical protein
MASTQSWVNHFMYDYISLEGDIPNPKPILELTKQDVTCYGCNDGSITATFSNGTPPYQVKLNSNGAFNQQSSPYTFNNLVAGDYTVYVTDSLNESDTASITLIQPDKVTAPGDHWITKPYVFPNPSRYQFILIMLGEFEYQLFDLSGKPLLQGKGANVLRFGGELAPGIFLLRIKASRGQVDKTYILKLVKL